MSLGTRIALFLLAIYSMFAQPGIPACWLMEKPCEVHFHLPGMAEVPHSHEYLFDMARSSGVPILPMVSLSASQLLTLLGLINLWQVLAARVIGKCVWIPGAQIPPPKNFPAIPLTTSKNKSIPDFVIAVF